MERPDEQKFIVEFIELYHTLPALWDTFSKKHCDRTLKCEQYSVLLEKYKQWDPRATLDDMKKKINALRTNYRRERKRLLYLKKKEPDDEYYAAANLYYFKALDFLRNCEAPTSSVMATTVGSNDDNSEIEPKPKKKKSNSSTDELVRLATLRLKSTQGSYHQIANVWANKLSKMDRNQRIIAEKIINDVMFNGELGLLNYDSTLTNIGSVCSLNPPSSLISNTTNTNETSAQSRITNSYNTNDINPQRFSEDHIKYPSPSLLISSDVITGHESDQMEDNFIVAEYDPLANSIKTED